MTGETMHIQHVQDFDRFFVQKYNQLTKEALSITQHYDYSQDILHDCYAKVRQRIYSSGFTGQNYHGFLWMAVQNEWKVLCNRKKIRTFVDIDHVHDDEQHGYHHSDRMKAEQQLLVVEQWNNEVEQYYQQIERIVMILFNFIETNYPERDATLFKMYFIDGTTYKDLSKMSGYSQAYISNTIKPMKKSLKYNFEEYLRKRL
jgi:RNA polymerase sigma factor (sigma-70 family)